MKIGSFLKFLNMRRKTKQNKSILHNFMAVIWKITYIRINRITFFNVLKVNEIASWLSNFLFCLKDIECTSHQVTKIQIIHHTKIKPKKQEVVHDVMQVYTHSVFGLDADLAKCAYR